MISGPEWSSPDSLIKSERGDFGKGKMLAYLNLGPKRARQVQQCRELASPNRDTTATISPRVDGGGTLLGVGGVYGGG